MKIRDRLTSIRYTGWLTAHYTGVATAMHFNQWMILTLPFTLIKCLSIAGQETKTAYFADAIKNKTENDIMAAQLKKEGVEYEKPSYFETVLGR